jgi:hypothetical protein
MPFRLAFGASHANKNINILDGPSDCCSDGGEVSAVVPACLPLAFAPC